MELKTDEITTKQTNKISDYTEHKATEKYNKFEEEKFWFRVEKTENYLNIKNNKTAATVRKIVCDSFNDLTTSISIPK